jgi:hypothetical protein
MNEQEQAQWLVDNMFEIIGDMEKAKLAARFAVEEIYNEVYDFNQGESIRTEYWTNIDKLISNE